MKRRHLEENFWFSCCNTKIGGVSLEKLQDVIYSERFYSIYDQASTHRWCNVRLKVRFKYASARLFSRKYQWRDMIILETHSEKTRHGDKLGMITFDLPKHALIFNLLSVKTWLIFCQVFKLGSPQSTPTIMDKPYLYPTVVWMKWFFTFTHLIQERSDVPDE